MSSFPQVRANGAILWSGCSRIDDTPIVVIATGLRRRSKNAKVGNMLQTWILRQDMAPNAARNSGKDTAVCGDCPLRGKVSGGNGRCYVRTFQAPRSIWGAFSRGVYPVADPADVGTNRNVRIGSYGDPAAVPPEVWEALVSRSAGRTGYTHQWRKPIGEGLRSLVMASADSEADRDDARALGWRSFRIRASVTDPVAASEIVCPASAEGGRKVECAECKLCSGADKRRDVVIALH